jgi:CheY-like chemotaxis protein
MVATILTLAGAAVETAASAREAVIAIERSPHDVMVSDIGMPDEDGYSLMRQVRMRRGWLPAVALTAYARAEDRARALEAGFASHLCKPVEPVLPFPLLLPCGLPSHGMLGGDPFGAVRA